MYTHLIKMLESDLEISRTMKKLKPITSCSDLKSPETLKNLVKYRQNNVSHIISIIKSTTSWI